MGSHTSKKHGSSRKTQLNVPKYDLNQFGVITILFNPLKYKSRYELYHKFDEHMSRSGVTLLTVECIFETSDALALPLQKFELTRANDPRHLQIKAPSVLWLKENLINIAVRRLPAHVQYIAWLDADIEFERSDWPHLAIDQLQQYPIVQLFELSLFLGPAGKKQVQREDYSFAYAIRHEQRLDPRRSSECYVHPGYAWAMRRTTFEDMGGLLDFSILGSGDIHFAYALLNRIEETIPVGMNEDYSYLARIWGQRVAQLSGNGALVGYVPVNIYHYWHGSRVNRGYFERWNILERFHFSPLKDLEKNNHTGLLRLTNRSSSQQIEPTKRFELFEKTIVSYFRSRNEDNLKKPIPSINTTINSKSRISSHDVVRPTHNTLPTRYRTYNDDNEYSQLPDARSGYYPNETNSFSIDMSNDSFYPTSSRDDYPRRFYNQNFPRQLIYYDDEDGNHHARAPDEISF